MHHFKCNNDPYKSKIQNWTDHFKKYGMVENFEAGRETRPNHPGRPGHQTANLVEWVRVQQRLKRFVPN